jgi:hypothetical protein
LAVNFWSVEQTEMMKTLWLGGMSAKNIAQRLVEAGYPATKNSVIGKVNRLKINHCRLETQPIEPPEPLPPPRERKKILPQTDPAVRLKARVAAYQRYEIHNGHRRGKMDKSTAGNVLLLDAKDGQCRAILGYKDNDRAKAICCGTNTPWVVTEGRSKRSAWCEHHRSKFLTDRGKKEL